ncbi:MAG: RluA family pseudouridine synthase [Chitinispirillaceae bacterium]
MSEISDYKVSQEFEGCRLDQFLSGFREGESRSFIQKIIASEGVRVNGRVAVKNTKLNCGDQVVVDDGVAPVPGKRPEPQDIPLDILFEDEHFAAINKPSGLVVHPGNGNLDGTVVNALLHRFGSVSNGFSEDRPGIVHRLDKDTSGALLVAKTNTAHTALAKLFSSRRIHKTYIGVCVGSRPADHEIIDMPISRSRRDPLRRAVNREGKAARTEYELLFHNCGISLVKFILHTGRTHQIRVHCSAKGFPIVQDSLYGGGKERVQRLPPLERPYAYSLFKSFSRQALHARSLKFSHPLTDKEVCIEAPYPCDFQKAMELLGDEIPRM